MEARGLLSRVSVRGTLTDVHYEIARTQVAVLNSTLWSYVCAAIDDRNLEDGNSIERWLPSNTEQAHANQEASSAKTPPAA